MRKFLLTLAIVLVFALSLTMFVACVEITPLQQKPDSIPSSCPHVYANECDTTCEICGAERSIKHSPVAIGEAIEPTCDTQGITAGSQCSLCGVVLEAQQAIAALGHKEDIIPGKAPTCKEAGLSDGKQCSVCGEITVPQVEIAKLAHTEVVDEAVAPTCTATGLTEGKHCSVCGEVTLAQQVVDALGHTHVAIGEAKEPTCSEEGITAGVKCGVCGTVIEAQVSIEKLTHVWAEDWTYDDNGHWHKCVNCDATTNALDHVIGDDDKCECGFGCKHIGTVVDVPAVNATCTTAGSTAGTKCTECNHILSGCEKIDAIGHDYEATFTWNEGNATILLTCKNDANHKIDNLTVIVTSVTTDASCLVDGKIVYTGKVSYAGKEYSDTNEVAIDANGHTWSEDWECDATGHWHVCTVADCGAKGEVVAHNEIIYLAVAPTCTTPGKTEGSHCADCDYVITAQEEVAIDAGNHPAGSIVTVDGIDSTCGRPGLTDGSKCDDCGVITTPQTLVDATNAHKDDNSDGLCDVCALFYTAKVTTSPVADKAYQFTLVQATKEMTLYLNGKVSGRYLATTTLLSEAVVVYAEVVDGGYKFYIEIDGVKNYINIYKNSEGKDSVNYATETTTVFAYDIVKNIWISTLDEVEVYLGCYTSQYDSYTTVSVSKVSFITTENYGSTQFPLVLVDAVCSTHANDPSCADCSLCGAPSATGHIYDNGCDATCNSCGAEREANHKDDDEDFICDVCDSAIKIVLDFTAQGYENAFAIESLTVAGLTATPSYGTNEWKNLPKYYTADSTFRMYVGNDLTLVKPGFNIVKVVINADKTNLFSVDGVAFTTDTWTGSSNSLLIVSTGTVKITSIEITVEKISEHVCDSGVVVDEIPATCTADGYTAGTKCSVCGEIQSGCEVIPALDHNKGENPEYKFNDTYHWYECLNGCGEYLESEKHTKVEFDGVPATCTEAGMNPGIKCTVCMNTITEPSEQAALGHVDADSDGKCDREGCDADVDPNAPVKVTLDFTIQNYTDGFAFESLTSDGITAVASQGTNKNNAPKYYISDSTLRFYANNTLTLSIEKEGYVIISVKLNGVSKTSAFTVDGTAIANGEWLSETGVAEIVLVSTDKPRIQTIEVTYKKSGGEVTPPAHTCTYGEPTWVWADDFSTATATFTCTDVNCTAETKTGNVVATGDAITYVDKQDCSSGERTYTAVITFSDKEYTNSTKKGLGALGHDYSIFEWTFLTSESGEKTALMSITCARDNSHVTSKFAETLEYEVVTPATCQSKGEGRWVATATWNNKTETDYEIVEIPVNAEAHNWAEAWVNNDATGHWHVCLNGCDKTTEFAEHTFADGTCSVCGYGCNHTGGTATCEKLAECTKCGKTYGTLAAHTTTPVGATPSDCENAGTLAHDHCTVCGKNFIDGVEKSAEELVDPADGHKYDYSKSPAWTWVGNDTDGYTSATASFACANCDKADAYVDDTIEVATTDAKCEIEGSVVYNASITIGENTHEDSKTVVLAALEHTKEDIGTAITATCGRPGITAGSQCKDCKEVLDPQEIIPATGEHEDSDNDGYCNNCGLFHTASVVTAPVADKAYKFTLVQTNKNDTYYLNGQADARYLLTSTNLCDAKVVYAEVVEGGVKFYILVDNVKNYITFYTNSSSKDAVGFATDGNTVFNYDVTTNAWVADFNGTDYYLGTYSTYNTISASQASYISASNTGVSQFPLVLVEAECPHDYKGACDADCTYCGETRDANDHTIVTSGDNIPATCLTAGHQQGKTCSECGTVIQEEKDLPILSHEDKDNDGYCDNGCGGKLTVAYVKVTETPTDWSGKYLIVYEVGGLAFDGSLAKLDASSNTQGVTIIDGKIAGGYNDYVFTISAVDGGYAIQSASGYYIGQTSNANGLKSSTTTAYVNTITIDADGNVVIISGGAYLRYNDTSDQERFRYYKSSSYTNQKAIALYKLVEIVEYKCAECSYPEGEYFQTEDGKHYQVCSVCGFESEHVAHTSSDWIVDSNATCTTDGAQHKECTVCKVELEKETINAKGHAISSIPAVEATCTSTGNIAYFECETCGTLFSDAEGKEETTLENVTVAMKDHSYTEHVADGNAEQHTFKCANCDATTSSAHNYGEVLYTWSNDNTQCTATRTCSACDYIDSEDASVEGKVTQAQTCVLPELTTYTATFTNEAFATQVSEPTQTKAATGHTEEELKAVAPTCTTTGLTAGTKCSVCGEILKAQEEVAVLGHTEEVVEGTPATCTESGLTDGKKCSVCGETLVAQEPVDATGHNYFGYGYDETYHYSICGNFLNDVDGDRCCHIDETTKVEHTFVYTSNGDGTHKVTCEHETCDFTRPSVDCQAVVDEAVAPTCTTTGLTEGSHCDVCGKTLVAQETVDALGHTEEVIPAVDATCTETGLTEGKKCSVCGTIIKAQEEVSALGHTVVVDVAVDATCTKTGLTEGSHCEVCGEILKAQEVVEKLPHTVVTDPAVAPTCQTTGKTEGSHCSVCREVLVAQQEISVDENAHSLTLKDDAEGHWNECTIVGCTYSTEKEAHTMVNEQCSVCQHGCDHTTKVAIGEAKDPTCTEKGITAGEKCAACGKVFTAQEDIPANGHTNEEIPAVKATCTTDGSTAGVKCSVCQEVLTAPQTIQATGHTAVVDAAVAPTCENTGLTEGSHCGVCNETLVAQDTVDALGHDMKVVEGTAVDPTCVAAGKEADQKCSRCDHTTTGVAIEAKGHTEGEWEIVTDSTCIAEGSMHILCTVCGEELNTEVIAMKDHVYATDFTVDTPATCTLDGSKSKHCTQDGCEAKSEITVIPASHTAKEVGQVDATCVADGKTAGVVCSVCNEVISGCETIPAIGHVYDNDCDTTCNNDGCTAGDREASHSWLNATCTTPMTCSVCDATEGDPLGHIGGTATCENLAVCTKCTKEYGNLAEHNYGELKETAATCTATGLNQHYQCSECEGYFTVEKVATTLEALTVGINPTGHTSSDFVYTSNNNGTHDKTYKCCGTVVIDNESCSGGSATCVDKAVCEHCDTAYGEVAEHTYGEVTYTWSEDNSTVTASRTCSVANCGNEDSEIADTTSQVTQDATCELPELTTYTATFKNEAFANQTNEDVKTSEALGHTPDSNNHCTICEKNLYWAPATSINVGDEIILTYGEYVMTSVDSGSKGIAEIVDKNSAMVLTVVAGSNAGEYALMTPDGQYLAYTKPTGTSSNNNLWLVDDMSSNGAIWTIELGDNGACVITNVYATDRCLKFNTNNTQQRFSCYTNGMGTPIICKLTACDCNGDKITVEGKDSTCTATGLTEGQKCAICGGVTIAQDVIEMKAHDFANGTWVTTDANDHWKKCANCDAEDTDNKIAHVFDNNEQLYLATPADCENAATYYYYCDCGALSKDTFSVGTAGGHGAAQDSTWYNDGDTHYQLCDGCGVEHVNIGAHTYECSVNADGTHSGVCKCGATIENEPHVSEAYTRIEGTNTHSGTCSVCGTAFEHNCVDGNNDKNCDKCNGAIETTFTKTINVEDQNYTNAQIIASMNIGDVLVEYSKGSGSNDPKFYSSDNTVRVYINNKITFSIDIAGYSITSIVFKIDKASNISSDGYSSETLTWTGESSNIVFAVSGTTKIQSITVTYGIPCEHANKTAVGEAKVATCTEEGITAGEKCVDCGVIITAQETIPATGHNYVDGICSVCGESESTGGGETPAEPVTTKFTASENYSANTGLDGTNIAIDEKISMVFTAGGTATQYYTNGSAIRWYGGGTLTVSAIEGYEITEIVITYGGTKKNEVTADVGSFTDASANSSATWTGTAQSVKFTQAGTTGQDRIVSVEVTYSPAA